MPSHPVDNYSNNDWHGGNWKGGGGTSDWLSAQRKPTFASGTIPAGFSSSPWSSNATLPSAQQPVAGVSSKRTNTVEGPLDEP